MTGEQWQACRVPKRMLHFLLGQEGGPRPGDRKLCLFACACCRAAGCRRFDPAWYETLCSAAERYAEGVATAEAVQDVWGGGPALTYWYQLERPAEWAVGAATAGAGNRKRDRADLVRCVFGNPFRPAGFDPNRRTPEVTTLAEAAYELRMIPSGHLDPARLAVLSDALEEAGCTGEALDHLRSPGPHVRGCWALDLVLGKA